MSTPRKNFNYASPYAKHMQQYPSQSDEYISFDVGGQFQSGNDGSSGKLHYPGGSSKRRGNSNFCSNLETCNSSGTYSTQKHWGTPRKTGGYYKNRLNKEKHEQLSISSYLHPSMTEDPWQEFMERIDAINNSKISIKSECERDNGSKFTEMEDEGVIETRVV